MKYLSHDRMKRKWQSTVSNNQYTEIRKLNSILWRSLFLEFSEWLDLWSVIGLAWHVKLINAYSILELMFLLIYGRNNDQVQGSSLKFTKDCGGMEGWRGQKTDHWLTQVPLTPNRCQLWTSFWTSSLICLTRVQG